MAAWYAMSQSLVKLTEIGTSWGGGGGLDTLDSNLIVE